MLIFEVSDNDLFLFENFISENLDKVLVSSNKKFIGGPEVYNILVTSLPVIIPSITLIIQNIITYKQSQYVSDNNNQSEVKIKVKKADNEYEFLFTTSSIKNTDEIDKIVNDLLSKINVLEITEQDG